MSSQEFPNQADYAKCSSALKKKMTQTINENRFVTLTASPNLLAWIKPESRSQNSNHGKIKKFNHEK